MKPDRLVYMANQIGKFFELQRADEVVPGIADHIRKFGIPECARRSLPIWTRAAKASTLR